MNDTATEIQTSTDPESLIQRAIDANVPVESLGKLIDMRQSIREENATEAYFTQLSLFQAECPSIEKQSTAKGGKFSYKYAPLDHIVGVIRPHLTNHGFSFTFDSNYESSGDHATQHVTCKLHHSLGHSEVSTFSAPVDPTWHMNDVQKAGAALSYGKRYALCDILGITTGDDIDGYTGPTEHGVPGRVADAPKVATRNERKEVSRVDNALEHTEAGVARVNSDGSEKSTRETKVFNLHADWFAYRSQRDLVNDDDSFREWIVDSTDMNPGNVDHAEKWTTRQYNSALKELQSLTGVTT